KQKVLIAGDSVANGPMLDDSDTLASQLQQHDETRQYVNLGINNAAATDEICALKAAEKRYSGEISELIYFYCENDFGELPLGRPEEVIAWLCDFAKRQKIGRVTVIYGPYVYNVVPDITRFHGFIGETFPTNASERLRLANSARSAGFQFVDFGDIAKD